QRSRRALNNSTYTTLFRAAVHRDHTRLLGEPEAPLVVAQDPELPPEGRVRLIPALDAAADLVDQHDGLGAAAAQVVAQARAVRLDRMSTRLNSSHQIISCA